jgi:hypothetical protein
MNKKFFTLIASAFMLVASLGTANALGTGTPATPATKMDADAQKGVYHLRAYRQQDPTTLYVVYVNQQGILKIENYGNYLDDDIANALWCVSVKSEEEGANPRFDFVNRAGGGELAVDFADFAANSRIDIAQGDNKGWKFSATYAKTLQANRPLTTYYKPDSVLVLTYDNSGSGDVGVVRRLATANGNYPGAANNDVLIFTIVKPEIQSVSAYNYNTRFGTEPNNDSIKLVFDKDRNNTKIVNPWTDYALRAEVYQSTGAPGSITTPNTHLNFKRADGKYLRVDTAWTNASGVKFLAFGWGDIASTGIGTPVTGFTNIREQYNFTVDYDFTTDELDIRVQSAYLKHADAAANARWFVATGATPTTQEVIADNLRVKLQDLSVIDEIRIVTIGAAPVNTKILFKFGSCAASSPNFTSLDNDLYVISRTVAAGLQYLAVPVYTFQNDRDTVPQWISLQDNVDPKRMPAYQWVVEKTRTNNTSTSPIKITNREFPSVKGSTSTQLYTDKATRVRILGTGNGTPISNSALDFELVAANFSKLDKSIKSDSTLGYFFIDSLTAKTYTYEFNYLHKYKGDEYLSVKSTNDSSLVVSENKSMFKLDLLNSVGTINELANVNAPVSIEEYGYTTDNVDDLVQLKRVRYGVRVPSGSGLIGTAGGNRYIVVDKEDRYAVSAYNQRLYYDPIGLTWGLDWVYGVFYLKTNNTVAVNSTDYYAMIDMRNGWKLHTDIKTKEANFVKVGIDDNSLWAYKQSPDETRTSAFAIAKYTEPLYRRFDHGSYGKKPVIEPYGDETNAPVWLKFTKYNNLGNEFLFENSPKGKGNGSPTATENDYRQGINDKSISFLGLYNINQFNERGKDFSYSFYVDTAYVRAETPMPQYMLAINPEFVKGDTIWFISKDSVWNSNNESWFEYKDTSMLVRPSFTRGSYVFNAQDSIGFDWTSYQNNFIPQNGDYQGKFVYGAEKTTRLAFVDGIHYGDTFYVVRQEIATSKIDTTFFWNIPAADKHYLGENTHYDPRWYQDWWNYTTVSGQLVRNTNAPAYNLDNNGKSMVFQFRLVDPANDRRFLIESQRRLIYNSDGTINTEATEIAPMAGRWLKIQNGVPVMSDDIDIIIARQNGAEIFDVTGADAESAVGNELAPATSAVKVIGETGAVTILNAGGKKVAISNILGQTVAAQVVSSDNATIALPKGIVVVAVEGEAAVKAIVK